MITTNLIWTGTLCLNATVAVAATAMMIRRVLADRMQRARALRGADALAVLLDPQSETARGEVFGDPAARAALLHLLTLLRGAEAARVVETARAHGASHALCRAVRKGSVRQRIVAAEALGFFPEGSKALSLALADPDERVGVAAMKSLVRLGDGVALQCLLEQIRRGGVGRQSALAAVLREAAMQSPGDVTFALEQEMHPSVQILLIDAMAAARIAGARGVLQKLAVKGHVPVQVAARQALTLCNQALAPRAA